MQTRSLSADYYYKLYGKKIYNRYRSNALKRFGRDFFNEENNFGAPIMPKRRKKEQPTFWEFVQFVLDAER